MESATENDKAVLEETAMAVSDWTRAIEHNTASFLLALGRPGGAAERNDERLQWTIGGSPIDYHNAVVAARLAPDEADEAIRSVIDEFQARNVPGSWHLGPSMAPADLGDRLLRHGFIHAMDEPGMALELAAWNRREPDWEPPLQVLPVLSSTELATWDETLAQGFGSGPHEAHWVASMYRQLGYGPGTPWRHYLARQDGQPVGTATMFLDGDVAGIYFVFTLPSMRGQGIGTSIMETLLSDAKAEGMRLAVLTSSAMGAPLYQRMGFTVCCTIGIYEYPEAD